MALTQQRPAGVFSGRRYGLFTKKALDTGGTHPVSRLMQQRPPGVFGGRRYGPFDGKGSEVGGEHPVAKITQQRAPGLFSGRRYGSFSGKPASALAEWDVATPLVLPQISGTLALVTSFQFVGPGAFNFAPGTLAMSGALSASASISYTTTVALGAPSVAISGQVALAADVEFSSAPLLLQTAMPRVGKLPQLRERGRVLSTRKR